jgi:hypothetical protein
VPAVATKYTQQAAIDVGDVPGHQVRIYEIKRTYPSDPPVYDGVRGVESWTRGYSDYVDLNGRAWGYSYLVMENGDKIFFQYSGTTQTTVKPDGSKETVYNGVATMAGGTGKFRGIRGHLRSRNIFDLATGSSGFQEEGEYWME